MMLFLFFFFLMIRRPPRSTRTDTLVPTRRSSDLDSPDLSKPIVQKPLRQRGMQRGAAGHDLFVEDHAVRMEAAAGAPVAAHLARAEPEHRAGNFFQDVREILGTHHRIVISEEHTSELPSLIRTSYAVFCLKKKSQPLALNTTTDVLHDR